MTVEKKEGKVIGHEDILLTDLPGIYSLSPYTLEEVLARDFLVESKPDLILNVVDGTNLERNLYLSSQLFELGIPVIVAVNLIDAVEQSGDSLDLDLLSHAVKCPVIGVSALKSIGIEELIEQSIQLMKADHVQEGISFSPEVEKAVLEIAETLPEQFEVKKKRWYSIKLFENDERILEEF